MTQAQPWQISRSRSPVVDPFALPRETTGRLRMLVALALVAAWGLPALLVEVPNFALHGHAIDPEIQALVSRAMTEGWHSLPASERRRIERWRTQHPAFGAVGRQLLRLLLSAGMASTLVLGAISLRRLSFRRQSRCCALFEAGQAPRIVAEVRHLARRLTGFESLEIRWKHGFLDGLAIGTGGRRAVVIAGHPRQLERGWTDLHQAVLLHELGHWANGDVCWREWVRSLLLTLGALAGLSLLLAPFLRPPGTGASSLGRALEIGVILALACALWAGLVREREIEADWRVVSWGWREALERRLALPQAFGLPDESEVPGGPTTRMALAARRLLAWRPWRFHPSNRRRLEALRHPEDLFAVRLDLAILSGLSLALVAGRMGPMSMDLLLASGLLAAPFFLLPVFLPVLLLVFCGALACLALGFTSLLTGALGAQALRAALVASAGERARSASPGLVVPSLLFAASLEVGLWIFLGLAPDSVGDLPWVAAWVGVVALLVRIWLGYVSAWGRGVLGRWAGCRVPKGALRALAALSALLLSLLLGPAFLARGFVMLRTSAGILAQVTGPLATPDEELAKLVWITAALWVGWGLLAALLGGVSLGAGRGLVVLRGRWCLGCGQPFDPGPVLGRACSACGEDLAPWARFRKPPHSGQPELMRTSGP